MQEIERIISILGKQIDKLNRELTSVAEVITTLDTMKKGKIWEINVESLIKNCSLTDAEKDFFTKLSQLPSSTKEMLSKIGFSPEQKIIINSILNKISQQKEIYEKKKGLIEKQINKIKELIEKVQNYQEKQIINDIDLIESIMNNNNISTEEQIEIYTLLNKVNLKALTQKKEKPNEEMFDEEITDEEILSEDLLTETNMPPHLLDEIFKEFNVDWTIDGLDENEAKKREEKLNKFKEKILKYGNYDKIRETLLYLRELGIEYIFKKPEILTKVLLYSSKDLIEKLINTATEHGIDYKTVIEKGNTFLYPTIRERNGKRTPKGGKKPNQDNTSGGLTHFCDNIKWLDEMGFSAKEVFERCPTFFRYKNKTVRKVYNRLKLYGITLTNEDGSLKKGFSALRTLDVMKKLDIGIECGAYDYYQENVSKLVTPNLNLYRIKHAISRGVPEISIFIPYTSNMRKYHISSKYSDPKYSNFETVEDTFNSYGAKKYQSENTSYYEKIIEENENDIITERVKNNESIIKLEKYKKDELRYDFNGVIISRMKVLRYYQTLLDNNAIINTEDALMYVITKDSMLNEKELNKIEECLYETRIKRREKVD